MVQQGRLVAAALGGQGELEPAGAEALLRRLDRRTEARLRIFGRDGALLADSSRLGPRRTGDDPSYQPPAGRARENLLYRVAAGLYRLYRDLRDRPAPASPSRIPAATVRDALAGRYGATVRPTGTGLSVTLYSAIPI